jgi:hypothetical protein
VATVQRLRVTSMVETFDALQAAGPIAAQTVIELMDVSQPARIRLDAARVALAQLPRLHEAIEMEHRVRTLESSLAPDEPGARLRSA